MRSLKSRRGLDAAVLLLSLLADVCCCCTCYVVGTVMLHGGRGGRKGIHRRGRKQCTQGTEVSVVYDQVLEAAVIAIPHPKWTERPLLVVVSAEGSKLTKEDMLNFLQVLH